MIAADTGAGEHFVKPGHAQLLSGLQRSGVSAIGVSGAPIRASNQGRLLVKLLDKRSGKVFTMDLGLGHTLPDLPVSLLSVSKLVPTGSSFYFSKEESWMKLPNGGAKIMLEKSWRKRRKPQSVKPRRSSNNTMKNSIMLTITCHVMIRASRCQRKRSAAPTPSAESALSVVNPCTKAGWA